MSLNLRISFTFLSIFLFFKPLYKYFEYVYEFPRVNISIIYFLLFLFLVLYEIYFSKENYNKIIINSFWLLLMISLIQLISFPWASDYSHHGSRLYLTTISRTLIEYWLFWFVGINIKEILSNETFWRIMSFLWLALVFLVLQNALSNDIFGIILEGQPIYLMLADSFAIYSIFLICLAKSIRMKTIIIIIAIICLVALFSRASLYCFILMSFLFLIRENRKIFFVLLASLFCLIYYGYTNGIIHDRMISLIVGAEDRSANMRIEDLNRGIEDLSDNWVLGTFMGDVENNFGDSGEYIHNYLSFWRQFGFIPFMILSGILIYNSAYIFYRWVKCKVPDLTLNFLLYFTVFSMLLIITSRSYVFPYIWLSVGGISAYIQSKKELNKDG